MLLNDKSWRETKWNDPDIFSKIKLTIRKNKTKQTNKKQKKKQKTNKPWIDSMKYKL